MLWKGLEGGKERGNDVITISKKFKGNKNGFFFLLSIEVTGTIPVSKIVSKYVQNKISLNNRNIRRTQRKEVA